MNKMIKKKFRDLTLLEFNGWADENCPETLCDDCPFNVASCDPERKHCWIYHKDMFSDKFLDQEIEIEGGN